MACTTELHHLTVLKRLETVKPRWLQAGSDGRVCLQCGRPGVDSWVGKIPWRRKWQPTPVLLLENPMDWGAWCRVVSMRSQRVRHDWVTELNWWPIRPFKTNTQKRYPFHYTGLKCKSRNSRNTWSTGKSGLGVQNEAGQRLIEFFKENTLVIANILFQQHKGRL